MYKQFVNIRLRTEKFDIIQGSTYLKSVDDTDHAVNRGKNLTLQRTSHYFDCVRICILRAKKPCNSEDNYLNL